MHRQGFEKNLLEFAGLQAQKCKWERQVSPSDHCVTPEMLTALHSQLVAFAQGPSLAQKNPSKGGG